METAIYAIAAVSAFIISFFAADEELLGSASCAGLLVVFWAINNALWMLVDLRAWSLLSDTAFTLLIFLVYRWLRQRWALTLALLYGVDAWLDGAWTAGLLTGAAWARAENMVFLAQLLAACWPGLKAIAGRLRGSLTRAPEALPQDAAQA